MALATVIVPPSAQVAISGFTKVEITARKVKAWGYQPDEAPLYCMERTSEYRDIDGMPFLELAELIRSKGEKRR